MLIRTCGHGTGECAGVAGRQAAVGVSGMDGERLARLAGGPAGERVTGAEGETWRLVDI